MPPDASIARNGAELRIPIVQRVAAPCKFNYPSFLALTVIDFLKATGRNRNGRAFTHRGKTEPPKDGSEVARREILDHVIPVNEEHLRSLIRHYVHQEDRVHDSLNKDTPNRRPVEPKPLPDDSLISLPRLGGLHHRYACKRVA